MMQGKRAGERSPTPPDRMMQGMRAGERSPTPPDRMIDTSNLHHYFVS
jgi:hypothetical protein